MSITRVTGNAKSTRTRRVRPEDIANLAGTDGTDGTDGTEVYFESQNRLIGPFRVMHVHPRKPGHVVMAPGPDRRNWMPFGFAKPATELWVLDEGEEAR